ALSLTELSLRFIDDCADRDDPHSPVEPMGTGPAMNLALALQAVGAREFCRRGLCEGEDGGDYFRSLLRVCQGQAHDLAGGSCPLGEYGAIVAHETVAAYEFAAALGPRVAHADAEVLALVSGCGRDLGWMTQILDDIEALWFPVAEAPGELEKRTF